MQKDLRKRRYVIVRIPQAEKDCLRKFYKLSKTDRYDTLLQLISYAEDLTDDDLPLNPLMAVRIGVPSDLDTIIRTKVKELGMPYVRILIILIQQWIERNE